MSDAEKAAPKKGPKKPIEEWATDRGMLPRYRETGLGPRLNPEYWKFHAARDHMKWADGQEVTEDEFNRGLAGQDALRYG